MKLKADKNKLLGFKKKVPKMWCLKMLSILINRNCFLHLKNLRYDYLDKMFCAYFKIYDSM